MKEIKTVLIVEEVKINFPEKKTGRFKTKNTFWSVQTIRTLTEGSDDFISK